MRTFDKKRIEKLVELTYPRALVYCRAVAKDSDDLIDLINQTMINNCQKLATGIYAYERDNKFQFSSQSVIVIVDQIINVIELNISDISNDVVLKVSDFMRCGVDPKLRILTGRIIHGVTINFFENNSKSSDNNEKPYD